MLAWFGTLASVAGSFLVAFGVVFIGYCFFAFGAMAWLMVAAMRKDKALFFLNAVFFCANIIGLARNNPFFNLG